MCLNQQFTNNARKNGLVGVLHRRYQTSLFLPLN